MEVFEAFPLRSPSPLGVSIWGLRKILRKVLAKVESFARFTVHFYGKDIMA
jgi:hypothetical protein